VPADGGAARAYEYRHVVGFEETNLVGNVYYANHVRWQGRVREMFLRDHAPGVLGELAGGLALVTTRVSCEYLAELFAFDEVAVRMRLGGMAQNRITMRFEYWRRAGEGEELAARGEQEVACMRREEGRVVPAPVPAELREALLPFAAPGAAERPNPFTTRGPPMAHVTPGYLP
jgi:enediyne biosynthesis thioesterase